MKKQLAKFIRYLLFVCALIALFTLFFPRNYNVPNFKARLNTKFWDLASGSRIGYTLIQGQGNKKTYPIIYLHGGPGGHISERDIQVLKPLSDFGYDIYLYDQIGSGQSQRLENIKNYTVDRHIEDLHEIIKQIGANKVILIGQSWGGILAALFVAANPDEVEKIIFTCPGPIYPVRQELKEIKAPDSVHLKNPVYSNAQGNRIANNIRINTISFFATKFGVKLASDKEADNFSTYLNYEVNKSTVCDTSKILNPDAGSGYYAGIMTYKSLTKVKDPRPKLKNLQIPVLIMKGQCDNQQWGFTKEYSDLFQNSQLSVIPNAGHSISVEQPDLYLKTILHFLNN